LASWNCGSPGKTENVIAAPALMAAVALAAPSVLLDRGDACTYDATGRLLLRTHWGSKPEGGRDEERPFVAKRLFTWDGDSLVAEAGLNFEGRVVWRQQYLPGPGGLDDSLQVHVERDLFGERPEEAVYTYVKDELGSVIAVMEEGGSSGSDPPKLVVRYLYTPYGEAHLERGPELLAIRFDEAVREAGGKQQSPKAGASVGGALVVQTTIALAPESYKAGVRIERWDGESLQWRAPPEGTFALAAASEAPEVLHILALPGWPKGERYRITLLPALKDGFGRAIQLPRGEGAGVVVELEVPGDGVTPPQYVREFSRVYDSIQAAGDTLCEVPPVSRAFLGGKRACSKGRGPTRSRGLATTEAAGTTPARRPGFPKTPCVISTPPTFTPLWAGNRRCTPIPPANARGVLPLV
jgi:hypothetical protein